jgi:RNA polymerase subunit RPABC4/transcription elongation factor Spt4
MSIFDKAKQGVDVAKFKADQLLRVNKVQNEIGALRRDITGVREKIAEAVVQLHKQGPLTYPEVEELCLKIDQLETQIAEKDAQIVAIRTEQPPIAVVAAGAAAAAAGQATAACPHCHAPVPVDAAFCPNCGKQIPPRPKCKQCGYVLDAEAMFCPNCGQRVGEEKSDDASATAEPVPEAVPNPNRCANCGFALPGDAAFCPECGTPHTPSGG